MKAVLFSLLIIGSFGVEAAVLTSKPAPARSLIGELPNDTSPQYYLQQLENTHQHLNQMMVQTRRQSELKNFSQNFNELQHKLDFFRDNLNRKLEELAMSLEHPKVPLMGPGPMMMHPYTNPMQNAASTIVENPMSSIAGRSSYMPAPSIFSSANPYSSQFSQYSFQQPGLSGPGNGQALSGSGGLLSSQQMSGGNMQGGQRMFRALRRK